MKTQAQVVGSYNAISGGTLLMYSTFFPIYILKEKKNNQGMPTSVYLL